MKTQRTPFDDHMSCTPDEAEQILRPVLNWALGIVLPLAQALDSTDTGVVLGVYRQEGVNGEIFRRIALLTGGALTEDQRDRYIPNSERKAAALNDQRSRISTFQCRDVDKKVFGGGARFARIFVFAPSGFAEWFDEMLACLIALRLKLVERDDVWRIARISRNEQLMRYLREHRKI